MRPRDLLVQVLAGGTALAAFGWFAAGTPGMILLPALLPAAAYASLLALLTRYRRELGWVLLAMLLGGTMLAGALSTATNELTQLALARAVGRALAAALTPAVAAPILEELCKALPLLLVLWLRGGSRRPVLDGIAYGALVGLGFAVAENLHYFTLAAVQGGLARSLYLRGLLGGLNHAIFTATVGAGIGGMMQARSARLGLAALGASFAAACAEHMLWNAWASRAITTVLCGASEPDGACRAVPDPFDLYVTVPVIAALAAAPGALLLAAILRRARRLARA
jgi:RsiW-degrading membrane proteinase PrsW (M82 family)